MKKPFVLIAAIVAVVGLGAAVAVARETITEHVGTSVKLEFRHSDHHPDAFLGTVKAARNVCLKGRTVILTQGKRDHFASDGANNRGKYKIVYALHDLTPAANYRAVAMGKRITQNDGDEIVCKRGTSKFIKLPGQ